MKNKLLKNIDISAVEKRLFSATLWNLLGNGFARLIMMITAVFLARILGAETFGKWGVIRSTISMFTLFLSFSLSVTTIKHLAQYRTENKEKAGKILSLSFLIALIFGSLVTLIVFSFSNTIALELLNDIEISQALKIAAFFVLLMSFNSVLTGALAGLEKFKFIALSNFIAGILAAPIILFLTKNYLLNGITTGYLVYYSILFICFYIFLKKELKKSNISLITNNLKTEFSIIKKYSLPALISGSIGGPAVFLVYSFVANLSGGFIIIGIFHAAKIIQTAIVELGSQLQNPLISLLSNEKNSKKIFSLSFSIPLLFITVLALPIIYLPETVAWVFNKGGYNIDEFTLVISLTLLTASIMIFKQGINRMIITNDLLWWGVYENLFWASILFLFSWQLIPKYGAIGLALSFLLAYLIDFIVILPFYHSKKLIPKTLVFSKHIIVVAIIFITGPILVYFQTYILLRVIILIASLTIMIFLIKSFSTELEK